MEKGSTRRVLRIGSWAIKFARGNDGVRCNQLEADLYGRSPAHRQSMLCPVLWHSSPAFILIMRRAETPITHGDADERRTNAESEWSYGGAGDDELPFEFKPKDWGYLYGKKVAVDYANSAR